MQCWPTCLDSRWSLSRAPHRWTQGKRAPLFRDDDPRTHKERAFAWAVISIGAVWYESGLVGGKATFCSDSDVQKAQALACAAGFDLLDASAYARDLCASEQFRTLHARVTDALMRSTYLDERELSKLLR
jgi:hypothetical protein